MVSQMNCPEVPERSPFNLDNDQAYRSWREQKLSAYPQSAEDLMVQVGNLAAISPAEMAEITRICGKANSVIYHSRSSFTDKRMIRLLGTQCGLTNLDENICSDEDGISGLQVMPDGSRHEGYIPYTNKPINWHTDGYYNTSGHQIRAMLLHCVSDSASGGENAIMDHEVMYILIREEDPEMIRALMQPDVMTIPANIEKGILIRNAQTGPVFSVDPLSGNLHMRYTARKRSIEWKQDDKVRQATAFMQDLFAQGSEYIFHYRLNPGEGIISNNALHNRTGFVDDDATDRHRLVYRARYFDRVKATDVNQIYQLGENTCCG
jgi:hypothetical protein